MSLCIKLKVDLCLASVMKLNASADYAWKSCLDLVMEVSEM